MRVNKSGEEGLKKLARAGEKVVKYETRLASYASEDSVTQADGLEKQLKSLSSWTDHPKLRGVRKRRMNDHRFYITGRNTDCRYTLIHVVVIKRDEEDRAEDSSFQSKI